MFGTNLHHLQAIALALHHAGVDWEGEFPSAWKEMKSKTPFGELPVLEAPAVNQGFRMLTLQVVLSLAFWGWFYLVWKIVSESTLEDTIQQDLGVSAW